MLRFALTMAVSFTPFDLAGMTSDRPLGPNFDFVWVHYADWVIATPMLLIDLAMLAGMKVRATRLFDVQSENRMSPSSSCDC